jgi:outer membrane beta-barrel protein
MMNRLLVLAMIAAGLVVADPLPAAAQRVQVSGPLAGEPAVRHMRMYRKGRLQLAPMIGFTLQDEFKQNMFFGAQIGFGITDWLGVSVWGAYAGVNLDTGLTDEVESKGRTTDRSAISLPSSQNFGRQTGTLNWAAALQLDFTPLRGKLALFQKVFVDTDFTIFAGVAAVGLSERADVPGGVCTQAPPAGIEEQGINDCVDTQFARSSRIAIAPTFGVGLNFYINDWAAILIQWRGLPFKWNTSGFDVAGNDGFPDGQIDSSDRQFHFNHMVNIGVSFFLPGSAKVTD